MVTKIKTQLPLSPQLINQYTIANNKGNNNICFDFDTTTTTMKPKHIVGYLSNLKIPHNIYNFDHEFLYQYMTTPHMTGVSNMIDIHASVICYRVSTNVRHISDTTFHHFNLRKFVLDNLETIDMQIKFIRSMVGFLLSSVDGYRTDDKIIDSTMYPMIGTNLAHLIKIPEMFLQISAETLYDINSRTYYSKHCDEYSYGGKKLIQYFIDSSDNLLHSVVDGLINRYTRT